MATRDTASPEDFPDEKDASEISTKESNHLHDAALGTQQEKNLSFRTAIRYYRKAALWSIVICK
jgi:hypothetical protein